MPPPSAPKKQPDLMDEAVARYRTGCARVLDELPAKLLACGLAALGAVAACRWGLNLTNVVGVLAAGMLALASVGVAAAVAAVPLLLQARFPLVEEDPEAARSRLSDVVAIHWINTSSLMATTVVLVLGAVVVEALPPSQDLARRLLASVAPALTFYGLHRWWTIVKEAFKSIRAAVVLIPDAETETETETEE